MKVYVNLANMGSTVVSYMYKVEPKHVHPVH